MAPLGGAGGLCHQPSPRPSSMAAVHGARTGNGGGGVMRSISGELDGLEKLAALRRQAASDASPELLEIMEAETRATREAVARATTYGNKPAAPVQTGAQHSPLSDSSGTTSPRRSYRESPRRAPSPRSPDAQMSQSDSSFQRRVQFGADRTLSFHQTAAERLAQRGEEIVAVILGSFDDGHASLEQMQRILCDMDPDRIGVIDAGAFGWAIEDMQLGLTVPEIDALVEALDARDEQVVEYNELLAALGASSAGDAGKRAEELTGPELELEPGPGPGPEPEPEPEPEPHSQPQPEPELRPADFKHRGLSASALGSTAVARADDVTLESLLATTDIDPCDPKSVKELVAFNDQLEAEMRRGMQQQSDGVDSPPQSNLTSSTKRLPGNEKLKLQLTGRAEIATAMNDKPKGEVADLWECTFEPNTRPQVLNRHGMVGVRPSAATARTRLLQEYVARELHIADTDYMSDKLLDEVVAEAAANGWLTQSNVKLVARKHGTEKLRTIANVLKQRNSMALVDAQLKEVQKERDRQRAADAVATERTNAQAQKAWVSDLRASTPNKIRTPWKPTRGVGTADGINSPRKVAHMAHDESVIMKKQHDSKYGSYSATAIPATSPRLERSVPISSGEQPMNVLDRMQADIAKRHQKMKVNTERGPAAQLQASSLPRRSPSIPSSRTRQRRRPSKMSPPRPARVSRTHLSPERANHDPPWLSKTGLSHAEEDAVMEERALAAIEVRLQRLAGEFNDRRRKDDGSGGDGGSPAKVRPRTHRPDRFESALRAPRRAADQLEPDSDPELEILEPETQPHQAAPANDSQAATNTDILFALQAHSTYDQGHHVATDNVGDASLSSSSSGISSPLLLPHAHAGTEADEVNGHTDGDRVDDDGSWMRRLGLCSIAPQLEELGVEEECDLKHLQESDIEELNLKVVTARKLRDAISRFR